MPLAVAGFSKRYGARTALESVSFALRDGEVLALVGPNGSGKTTLLESLAGVLPTDAGELLEGGRPLSAAARRARLLYLPDGISPWPRLRLGRVLDFFGRLHGAPAPRPRLVARELELEPHLESRLGSLSKGERKRALVALALVSPRPLALLDEPFDGLDFRQTRKVAARLRGEVATGRSLLVSVHALADATLLADRFVLLDRGRVIGEGTLAELRERAARPGGSLEEVFLALA